MREVEVKILDIDRKQVEEKLLAIGAKKVFDGELDARFYDFDNHRLAKTETLLRLRRKGEDEVELTMKKRIPHGTAKVMDERELHVDSAETMEHILGELGLVVWRHSRKHRISNVLGNVHFELDTIGDIPTYLEIEGPNLETVEDFVHKLGYNMDVARPWNEKQVVEHYTGKDID